VIQVDDSVPLTQQETASRVCFYHHHQHASSYTTKLLMEEFFKNIKFRSLGTTSFCMTLHFSTGTVTIESKRIIIIGIINIQAKNCSLFGHTTLAM
jgi:hypothetical protein